MDEMGKGARHTSRREEGESGSPVPRGHGEGSGSDRTFWERTIHQNLVEATAKFLVEQGYLVQADHLEGRFVPASPVNGFIPDVVGRRGEDAVFVEVETSQSLDDPVAHSQLKALCRQNGGQAWVVVPFDGLGKLLDIRRDLRLDFRAVPGYPFLGSLGTPR